MHEVLVNRLGGLSLPRKSVVRLTDSPDMTLDVYRGRKTTIQYNNTTFFFISETKSPKSPKSPRSLTASKLCNWHKSRGSGYFLISKTNTKMESESDDDSYLSDDGDSSPLRKHKGKYPPVIKP